MTSQAALIPRRDTAALGIALMISATIVFAVQDGISRHLAGTYNTLMVVMIRYWFFAAFVVALAMRSKGGVRAAMRTKQPLLQIFRGALLALEICVCVYAFTVLGLVESQAIFIAYPLLIAALSGPILGEHVGWRRWAAIGVGFIGVLVILKPSEGVFDPLAVLPLAAALMFALYGLLTRFAARQDSAATSFFWTGIVGAVIMTGVGLGHWQPMTGPDAGWMACLCITGVLGHWLLIKCYEVAEASSVQPFAYFHFIWSAIVGIIVFSEVLRINVAIGAVLIMSAGLFTLWRERLKG